MASHNDMGVAGIGGSEEQEEKKSHVVSFDFTKTASKDKPATASSASKNEKRDYLTGIDQNELQSTKPQEKPKELIIPLILKNYWHKPDSAVQNDAKIGKGEAAIPDGDSMVSQDVKELIEDSRRQLDQWQNGTESEKHANLSIPLLMLNKVPDGFEDGDHINLDLRPESSTEADYECVPVEAYGLAMLKGMGWKKGEGIGRIFKQDIKPIEHQLRPKCLGLGADRSAIKDLEPSKHKRPPNSGAAKQKNRALWVKSKKLGTKMHWPILNISGYGTQLAVPPSGLYGSYQFFASCSF